MNPGQLLLVSIAAITLAGCKSAPHGSAIAKQPSLNFLVIGDWGDRSADSRQRDVANIMGKVAEVTRVDFIVTLGDNFYGSNQTPHPPVPFAQSFEGVYTNESLRGIPWYATLGNHDYSDFDYADEIAYTTDTRNTGRWIMPSNYYKQEFTISKTNKALFIFLDTTPFSSDKGNREFVTNYETVCTQELEWLSTLLTNTPPNEWRLAFGHHPMFCTEYPHEPELSDQHGMQEVISRFCQAKASLYFAGHIHSLQHATKKFDGFLIHNFISAGGGSRGGDVNTGDRWDDIWAYTGFGFAQVTLYANQMHVTYWNDGGKIVGSVVVDK